MRCWIGVVAAVLAIGCSGAANAACSVKIIGEVKVEMVGRQPLLEGEINGKPIRFLADTGSFGDMFFANALKDYGLTEHDMSTSGYSVRTYGVGGVAKMGETTIPMMKLGTLTAGNMRMMVVEGRGGRAAGLMGANFLSQGDVEFDLAHGVVRFLRAQGCRGDEELYWGGAFSQAPMLNSQTGAAAIVVRVLLNGHPLEAQFDSGAFESVVTTHAAANLGGQPLEGVEPIIGGGIGSGRMITKIDAFQTFTFDQETARNPQLGVADLYDAVKVDRLGSRLQSDLSGTPDMLLGADFFLSHRILVSYSQRMVYLTYAGGSIFDPIKRPVAKTATAAPGG